MKLLEQYLYAIRKYLPYSTRDDIIKELRSQFLDEIEQTYGNSPSKKELEVAITNFGPPRQIANQYKSNQHIISPAYTDLYFFILRIVVLALTISLTVVTVIEFMSSGFTTDDIIHSLTNLPLRLFSALLQSFSWLTITFIIMTRVGEDKKINIDEDWNVHELKSIQLDQKRASKTESVFAIIFLTIALVALNIAPNLITIAEDNFKLSTLELGHRIDLDVFKYIMIVISINWILEIVYHIALLLTGEHTATLKIYDFALKLLGVLVMWFVVFFDKLYLDYTSQLGFRGVFIIIAAISTLELLATLIKSLLKKLS